MLETLLGKMAFSNVNMLFLLGLGVFGGTIGGRLFQKIRIPQVVGYIVIGILLGQSGLKVVNKQVVAQLQPFNYFALGLIGFAIGGELKKQVFVRYGKQFFYILFFEGVAAFVVVGALTGYAASFFLPTEVAWALGLLLGAISSSTAPAATTEVLREYKTRGPLTTGVLGIVALDDGLALMLFAIGTSLAGSLLGRGTEASTVVMHTAYEIFGSPCLGAASGFVLSYLLKRYSEEQRVLAFSLGLVLIVLGLSQALGMDMLLAAMASGVVVANFAPRKSLDVFGLLGRFTPPINTLFFVLVGAKLNLHHLTTYMLWLVGLYLVGRTAGKMAGAYAGAWLSGAERTVRRYLPLCLFSQGGVAIGMSIVAGQRFSGEIGNAIVLIVTATTFVVEILGPTFVKIAAQAAGETGRNVTEQDLINTSMARDVMDSDVPLIHKDTTVAQILQTFAERDNLYFPVVDSDRFLLGVLTIDEIKESLQHYDDLRDFLVAYDLMEDPPARVSADTALLEVQELMKTEGVEYMPIVSEENRLEGFLEARDIEKLIRRKLFELQKDWGQE